MKRLMIVLMVVFVFCISAFAQMGTGQHGGMTGGNWGWGFGIIIAILVIVGVVYMMKQK